MVQRNGKIDMESISQRYMVNIRNQMTWMHVIYLTILFASCSKAPINMETELVEKDGTYYDKVKDTPYTGEAYSNFRDHGKKSSGHLLKGKKEGEWVQWHESGKISTKENYVNGQANGIWEQWFQNGKIKLRASFRKGEAHGQRTEWYENGKKMQEGNFKDKE